MNGNIGKAGISREAAQSAEKAMEAVRMGKIKSICWAILHLSGMERWNEKT